MHIDRRLLGWGVFFLLLGVIPLAVRAEVLDRDTVGHWPLLWPVLVIGWGLGLVLRRTPLEWLGGAIAAITFGVMGGGLIATGFSGVPAFGDCGSDKAGTAFAAQRGSLAASADISIQLDCGVLDVTTADGSSWSLTGSSADGRSPVVTATASQLVIRPPEPDRTLIGGGRARTDWQVVLPRAATLSLTTTVNAGEGKFDLTGAQVTDAGFTLNAGSLRLAMAGAVSVGGLHGTVNAGSAKISVPGGSFTGSLTVNAGSVELCVPADTAIKVRTSGIAASNNLASLGLAKLDSETWITDGFDTATDRIDLSISANAGSFTLRMGGGCGA